MGLETILPLEGLDSPVRLEAQGYDVDRGDMMDKENTLSEEFLTYREVRTNVASVLSRQFRPAITHVNDDLENWGLEQATPWEIAVASSEINYYDAEGVFRVTLGKSAEE